MPQIHIEGVLVSQLGNTKEILKNIGLSLLLLLLLSRFSRVQFCATP